jgi:hypothetical protein
MWTDVPLTDFYGIVPHSPDLTFWCDQLLNDHTSGNNPLLRMIFFKKVVSLLRAVLGA